MRRAMIALALIALATPAAGRPRISVKAPPMTTLKQCHRGEILVWKGRWDCVPRLRPAVPK